MEEATPLNKKMNEQMQRYMALHFVDCEALVRRTGASKETIDELLKVGAAPGVIYVQSNDGSWWSALGAYVGREEKIPPATGLSWYNPAAVWWLRRALLSVKSGQSVVEASANNKAHFMKGFMTAIGSVEYASLAYPNCFDDAEVLADNARTTCDAEWDAWVKGAYGVCMRRFSAEGCIEKEALRARIVLALENEDHKLADDVLLSMAERLEALVLPFAPWERPGGTPGKAIDEPLARLGLGAEEPY
ncbi:MAG: hypothetical protein DHS20C05_10570 [Hyphococcus sp.]|nr:MAG: hypothetical protein DHS20C05_10570 [Marinicaulis sp.]